MKARERLIIIQSNDNNVGITMAMNSIELSKHLFNLFDTKNNVKDLFFDALKIMQPKKIEDLFGMNFLFELKVSELTVSLKFEGNIAGGKELIAALFKEDEDFRIAVKLAKEIYEKKLNHENLPLSLYKNVSHALEISSSKEDFIEKLKQLGNQLEKKILIYPKKEAIQKAIHEYKIGNN